MASGENVRVTINFGGSVLAHEEPDLKLMKRAAVAIKRLQSQKNEVLVVVGGGGLSRKLIRAARKVGASSKLCDLIGIQITQINARLLIAALGSAAETNVPTTYRSAIQAMLSGKIPVMGGTVPGQTTDAVTAMLADASKSDLLVYFVDVSAVYTSDPRKNKRAKKIDEMTAAELMRMVNHTRMKPGVNTIIDPIAARLIQRSGRPTLVLGADEISRLPQILKGASHSGTTIKPK